MIDLAGFVHHSIDFKRFFVRITYLLLLFQPLLLMLLLQNLLSKIQFVYFQEKLSKFVFPTYVENEVDLVQLIQPRFGLHIWVE